jgi:hypothetical protein
MRQILLSEVTYRICWFGRHFPSRNNEANGRAYIDDLLVITRGTLEDHLRKLREVLRR